MSEKNEPRNPTPTVACIIELSGDRINHGPLLADSLASKRTGQRHKL